MARPKFSALRVFFAALTAVLGFAVNQNAVGQEGASTPLGAYYPPTQGKASTEAEAYARGMADYVRSAGAASLMSAEAAKKYEDARAKYFDNRLRATQTYFEMKQQNYDYRQAMRGQRPSSEQLFRIAKERAPDPLSPSELDPYSGEVRWPMLLLAADYAEHRTLAEDLIRKRIADPIAMSVEERASLRAALNSLATQMGENIAAYDPKEYTSAKNFLRSLAASSGVGAL